MFIRVTINNNGVTINKTDSHDSFPVIFSRCTMAMKYIFKLIYRKGRGRQGRETGQENNDRGKEGNGRKHFLPFLFSIAFLLLCLAPELSRASRALRIE